jgi:hypothetical protein
MNSRPRHARVPSGLLWMKAAFEIFGRNLPIPWFVNNLGHSSSSLSHKLLSNRERARATREYDLRLPAKGTGTRAEIRATKNQRLAVLFSRELGIPQTLS